MLIILSDCYGKGREMSGVDPGFSESGSEYVESMGAS